MTRLRTITGWRAVEVLISAILVVFAVLVTTLQVLELQAAEYPSFAAIATADEVSVSRLPPFLPRDAMSIRVVHDIDTEQRWVAFSSSPATLRRLVRSWAPLSWEIARGSVAERPWRVGGDWPPELNETFWHTPRSTSLLSYHREAASGWCIAVEWRTGRAWGWTCEDAVRRAQQTDELRWHAPLAILRSPRG